MDHDSITVFQLPSSCKLLSGTCSKEVFVDSTKFNVVRSLEQITSGDVKWLKAKTLTEEFQWICNKICK